MSPHETDEIGGRIRSAAQEVSAPLSLREQIARRPDAGPRPGPSRRSIALVGAVLAIAATLTGLLAPAAPTVAEVADSALAAPTQAAPDGADYLPGYEAIGARSDTVAGRGARTVIYRRGAIGINYTIVDGKPLDLPGTRRATAGDLDLALATDGDVSLVVWHADGRTCILASRSATTDEMVDLLRRA